VTSIRVAAGVLRDKQGRVLITERLGDATFDGLWEFPGGKIDPGESASAALRRELAEELGIDIQQYSHLQSVDHQYEDRRVALEFYLISDWRGTPAGQEGQKLRWEQPGALDARQLLPADAPVLDTLQSMAFSEDC
jgi:8-oxo-dGTP diphosphatase